MIKRIVQRILARQTKPKFGFTYINLSHIKAATTPTTSIVSLTKCQKRDFNHYAEINEEFTDQEIEMQHRDNIEEVDILHKGFHEKYLDLNEIQSMNYQSANKSHSAQMSFFRRNSNYQQNSNKQILYENNQDNYDNYDTNQTKENYRNNNFYYEENKNNFTNNISSQNNNTNQGNNSNLTSTSYRGHNGFNQLGNDGNQFQKFMKNIQDTPSVQGKLEQLEIYLMGLKKQGLGIDNLQKIDLMQMLSPIIKTFKAKPENQHYQALFYLLNIAREDFLNIQLDQRILNEVRISVLNEFEKLKMEDIKRVFYASCLRHRNTQCYPVIDPHVAKAWALKIQDKLVRGQSSERELVLFFSYLCKDVELFRKMNKFMQQLILSWESGILMNGELLKTVVSIMSKAYLSQQQAQDVKFQKVYSLFFRTFHHLLADRRITSSQFHVILRNLLRSPLFLSAFYYKQSYPIEEQNSIIIQKNQCYAEIERFVIEQIEHFTTNQVLNVLNFYNIVNLQSSRPIVVELLHRLHRKFQPICNNFFSFNITLHSVCLYNIENPEQYLSLYSSTHSLRLPPASTNQLQISQAISLLTHILPGAAAEIGFPKFQGLKMVEGSLKNEQNNSKQRKNTIAIIVSVLRKISAQFVENQLIDNAFSVDIFVSAPPKFPSSPYSINQLPQYSFALDVLSEQDYVNSKDLVGSITLKNIVLEKLGIQRICITPSFSQHLNSLQNQYLQQKALLNFLAEQQKSEEGQQQQQQQYFEDKSDKLSFNYTSASTSQLESNLN